MSIKINEKQERDDYSAINQQDQPVHTSQKLDFKNMLQDHKDRTEKSLPYTLISVEDVMFIDERYLVSLECIYYQDDANYRKLSPANN